MVMGLVFKTQRLLPVPVPVLMVMLMLMLQSIAPLWAKSTVKDVHKTMTTTTTTQPVYELQVTVWPSDMDDMAEAVAQPLPVPASFGPIIIEEPVVVMPQMDDEYEDDSFEEGLDNVVHVTSQPPHQNDQAQVLVNYHKSYNNGTEEYKLLLTNGMANYQRIDLKKIKGKLRPVQQGYYTVPLDSHPVSYQTVYYNADENGYNVYKTDRSLRNPAYDFYLEVGRDDAN